MYDSLSDDSVEHVWGTGNAALIEVLRSWGITCYVGVTGGGVIHLAKHLEPYAHLAPSADHIPRLFTVGEYVAGFAPLGHYLASGRVAACLTTTGAATKLAASGLSDAKLHNIPALYLIALNATYNRGRAPLQDVSDHGMNIVAQLEAELGDACIVIDEIEQLSQKLDRVRTLLGQSKPVAIAFHPDVLSRPARISLPRHDGQAGTDRGRVETFSRELASCTAGRRVIIFVGSEAARCAGIQPLTTALSTRLGAPTVWSVNGANAVASDNPYGFGYMAFGGNDRALALWRGIGPGDVVIALGLDPGEYTLDLEPIAAGDVFHLTSIPDAYGSERGGFGHRVSGRYHQLRGDIACLVREILSHLPDLPTSSEPAHAPHDLNTRPSPREVRAGCVDLVAFYEAMTTLWRPGSIGFDDVCMAYKDRQYITQRPHRNIRFYALQDGSAMGAAFGLGLGAKLANPNLHTFVFSGDGCFRLFGGGLADAAGLGLRLFILNNGNYAIVETGLRVILPDVETRRYHGRIPRIDFALAALAHGWKPFRVEPDLRNLPEIMDACYTAGDQSVLVDIPVDGDQDIGVNPRVYNLKHQTHL